MQTQPQMHIPAAVLSSPEAILAEYEPLVRAIALHLLRSLPKWVELDDLVQWGQVGLLDCAARYNEHRNVKFSTYAKFRIRGAMLDGLRELDWAPRYARADVRRMAMARERFEAGNGRPATESELAQVLGVTLEELRERQMHAPPELVSMQRSVDGDRETEWDHPDEQPTPLEFAMSGQMRDRLDAAITNLPEREQYVLRSYFWEARTMAEIAVQLGVNESRICQMRKRAMERLRDILLEEGIRAAS